MPVGPVRTVQAVYLGLDLGTSGCRAAAFTEGGQLAASARRPVETRRPAPGRAEQEPLDWERAAAAALQEVVARLRAAGEPGVVREVRSLTLTGQMAGLVLVDRAGANPAPALIWQDGRAAEEAALLQQEWGPALYRRTGCPPAALYPLAKLRWLQQAARGRHGPGDEKAARRAVEGLRWVLSPRDELLRRLTGEVATDLSCAAATGLLRLDTMGWDPELSAWAGIDPHWLPPVRLATEAVGRLRRPVADEVGLPPGLPVVLGAGDGVAQNVGLGVIRPGEAVVSLGSSGVVRAVTARPVLDRGDGDRPPRLTVYPFLACREPVSGPEAAAWVANGATANAAGVLDWLRERLFAGRLRLEEALDVPPGAQGLIFLPFLAGERTPFWEPSARGVLVGLTAAHRPGHVARAAIEGVAMALRGVVQALADNGVAVERAVLAGGAACEHPVRAITASVLGLPAAHYPHPGLEAVRGACVLGLASEIRHQAGGSELDAAAQACERLLPGACGVIRPAEAGFYDEWFRVFVRLAEMLLPVFRGWPLTDGR